MAILKIKWTALEKLVLLLSFLILVTGFILYYAHLRSFYLFVQEDGIVEWITVISLLAASIVCMIRFFSLRKIKNWKFLTITFLLGLFLFFAAGEEISWGQRILGIRSSEFFEQNNAQGETNIHNLVVDGVKLNKLIFTVILGVGMAIYLLLLPRLYKKNPYFRTLFNAYGIPIPQTYQVIAFALLAILTTLIPDGKNAEILESCVTLVFFLIVRFPTNLEIYKPGSLPVHPGQH
jgi:hypothetical protein